MSKQLYVTKSSGEQSLFSEERIKTSLRRVGTDEKQINQILQEVKKQMYNGISTKKIYRIAFSMLKTGSRPIAARYHLKQGIMELGPSGFPFEKYIAEIMKFQGYATQTGQILQGKCVTHEMDVIAQKDNEIILIECKYHNNKGITCNVKIPLYIHSRFKDIEAHESKKENYASFEHKGWIVTNTRFTSDAIQYASCSGIHLLGWDHPFKNGLREQIDQSGLYPLTCLTTLTVVEKQKLLDKEIVLCNELKNNEKILKSIGIKDLRTSKVLDEINHLCSYKNTKP